MGSCRSAFDGVGTSQEEAVLNLVKNVVPLLREMILRLNIHIKVANIPLLSH